MTEHTSTSDHHTVRAFDSDLQEIARKVAAMGGLAHLWQNIPGVRFNRRALAWSYWLLVIGLGLMVLDLTCAGLVQADLWRQQIKRRFPPPWSVEQQDASLSLPRQIIFTINFAYSFICSFLCLDFGCNHLSIIRCA